MFDINTPIPLGGALWERHKSSYGAPRSPNALTDRFNYWSLPDLHDRQGRRRPTPAQRRSMALLPGLRFTNSFSIAIQIRWKFRFTLTSILLLYMARQHVQIFVAIGWPAAELLQGKDSIEFELRAKIVSETGPRAPLDRDLLVGITVGHQLIVKVVIRAQFGSPWNDIDRHEWFKGNICSFQILMDINGMNYMNPGYFTLAAIELKP